jgi:hypothetical protein
MLASYNLDSMYLKQTKKDPDWPPFKAAMQQEFADKKTSTGILCLTA